MGIIEKDYEEFLKLLNKHRVKYCIVGAYALAFYAVPRYTKDMDVFMEQSRDNASKILAALRDFGFANLRLTEKDLVEPHTTIQLGYEPVRIDLVSSIDGCSFRQVWKNRKKGSYGKEKVFFIGWRDLIRNKEASNRKQDQADLELLRRYSMKFKKKSGKAKA
ncbi:MAG: nucleotidyltransferase [Elusimicrobia bacterium]|nr:nucleotidyltransferase [Candidatus Obscuribacterium magneticum]